MLVHIVITLASSAVCVLVAGLCAYVSRTPGRRHYTLFAALAACAAIYCVNSAIIADHTTSTVGIQVAGHLSFALSFIIGILWLAFDSRQHREHLSRPDRYLIILLTCGGLIACIPGLALGEVGTIGTYWEALSYRLPVPNLLARLLMLLILTAFFKVWLRYLGLALAGDPGARLRLLGYSLWCAIALVEAMVAAGMLQLPLVGPLGFNAAFVAFVVDLSLLVTRNADDLRVLNDELSDRVIDGTEELIVTREALVASERHVALGRLAGSLGHEINNPLSYISGNLSFVRDTVASEPDRAEELIAIDDGLDGVARIKKIIEDLATYVRGTQKSGAQCHVQQAIDIAIRVVTPKAKFSMSIESKIHPLPEVAIEERLLVQTLVNLLMNAAQACEKASGEGIPVTSVQARRTPSNVIIEISDRGCGMTARVRERAFTPLFTTNANERGSGLGLFVCRSIMESVGGSIEISSQADIGTTAYLTIPVASLEGC